MPLKLPLYDYQKEVVEWAVTHPYAIIALQMGMGKSPIMIALKDKLPDERVLIICPSFLTINWKKEIQKFYEGAIISLFKASKDVYYPVDSDFVICSYDISIKHEELFEWATMVVLDEATAIKNMKAKRTVEMHRLIYENSISRVYPMTGTPIKNRVQEFYSLMALCNYNPRIADSRFLKEFASDIEFADKFSHRVEYDMWITETRKIKITKWEGIKNEEELKKWLNGIYISKKSDMPPILYRDIFVDDIVDKKLMEAWEDFIKNGSSSVAPTAKMEAAIKKAPMTVKYVKELIENGLSEGPTVIFTDHVEPARIIAQEFGVEPITGEMNTTKRQGLVDRLQAGEIPAIVGTYGAMAHGYTMTASNLIVENDYPWDPGTLEQADFRINRKGQTRPCQVHRILGSDQDKYILDAVLSKRQVLDTVHSMGSRNP